MQRLVTPLGDLVRHETLVGACTTLGGEVGEVSPWLMIRLAATLWPPCLIIGTEVIGYKSKQLVFFDAAVSNNRKLQKPL